MLSGVHTSDSSNNEELSSFEKADGQVAAQKRMSILGREP